LSTAAAARPQRFKNHKNVYSSLIRKAKRHNYYQEFWDWGKNIRKTWEVIISVLKPLSPPSFIPLSLMVDGSVVQGEFDV